MLEELSLKDLKTKFSALTQLPARKVFVLLACPSLDGCAMRSKEDWRKAIESIEFKLAPSLEDGEDIEFKELNSVYEEILLEQQSESEQSEASVQRPQYTEEDYQEGGTAWWNSATLDEVLRYQLGDDYASFRW
jgi:hypothetical protein